MTTAEFQEYLGECASIRRELIHEVKEDIENSDLSKDTQWILMKFLVSFSIDLGERERKASKKYFNKEAQNEE